MHTSQTAHGVCDLCMRAGKTRIMWLHGTVRVAVLHTITQICPLKVTHYIYGLRLGLHEGINASVAFLCGANEWRQLRLVTRLKFVIESHTVSVVLLLFFLSFCQTCPCETWHSWSVYAFNICVFFYCSQTCFSNKLMYYADIILFENIPMYT